MNSGWNLTTLSWLSPSSNATRQYSSYGLILLSLLTWFNNHISAKLEVVEQEVCLELIAIDREYFLTTYERKTVAKFKEELYDILF